MWSSIFSTDLAWEIGFDCKSPGVKSTEIGSLSFVRIVDVLSCQLVYKVLFLCFSGIYPQATEIQSFSKVPSSFLATGVLSDTEVRPGSKILIPGSFSLFSIYVSNASFATSQNTGHPPNACVYVIILFCCVFTSLLRSVSLSHVRFLLTIQWRQNKMCLNTRLFMWNLVAWSYLPLWTGTRNHLLFSWLSDAFEDNPFV